MNRKYPITTPTKNPNPNPHKPSKELKIPISNRRPKSPHCSFCIGKRNPDTKSLKKQDPFPLRPIRIACNRSENEMERETNASFLGFRLVTAQTLPSRTARSASESSFVRCTRSRVLTLTSIVRYFSWGHSQLTVVGYILRLIATEFLTVSLFAFQDIFNIFFFFFFAMESLNFATSCNWILSNLTTFSIKR